MTTDTLDVFNRYVLDTRRSYFGTVDILDIIKNRNFGHRKEKLLDLSLLASKVEFWSLYNNCNNLGLYDNFQRILSALFSKSNKSERCSAFCELLIHDYGLNKSMISKVVPKLEILQAIKSLDVFIAFTIRNNIEISATKELV